MKRIAMLLATLSFAGVAAGAQQKPDSGAFGVRFAGNLYIAPQIWPDIGADDDQKVGVGLGGMLGLALVIDDTRLGVGPHFGYNIWTANYSSKPNSATQSVTFAMLDAGLELAFSMDDFVIFLGKGTSTMEAYMLLDSGSEFRYPGLDGEKFGYQTVGVGFTMKRFILGIVHTSYDDAAKDASRLEIRLAIGR
jgi:hypothetical protein